MRSRPEASGYTQSIPRNHSIAPGRTPLVGAKLEKKQLTESKQEKKRIVVAVVGLDMPGVVAAVSSVLSAQGCNLEEVSQVTLHGQFALIGTVEKPEALGNDAVEAALKAEIREKALHQSVLVRDFEPPAESETAGEPYVVSVWGPDRNDIIASFSKIFAAERINIESLRAFPSGEGEYFTVFEVSVPAAVDRRAFSAVLEDRAQAMGLAARLQHRDIFEAIHRVKVD